MLALIEAGRLHPERLVARTVGLADAAALLPQYDHLPGSGMTMVDPTR